MSSTDRGPIGSLEHYETLLGDVYDWMQGGWDQKVQQSRELFQTLDIEPSNLGATALDLGAGTGYQSIPLAELGFAVTAVDASMTMLSQLQERAAQRELAGTVRTIEADLCRFADHFSGPIELVVCMGDTLTHLSSHRQVTELIADIHRNQDRGGHLVFGFRDGSEPLVGDSRFIPIRSDRDRVFTCFIEEIDDATVRVHDVLHLTAGGGFVQNVSSYRKIRLATDWLIEQLVNAGYQQPDTSIVAGMTIISAIR